MPTNGRDRAIGPEASVATLGGIKNKDGQLMISEIGWDYSPQRLNLTNNLDPLVNNLTFISINQSTSFSDQAGTKKTNSRCDYAEIKHKEYMSLSIVG